MQELLWLLLPVAAASGWWAAQRSARKEKELCSDMDPAYFRGLNYLLNEQPDKAIDVFIKLLDVDNETVETHLALGNLFRRRGEVDRAIRIHQNLIARPGLNREQRALALLELGQDYMRAGLFDRAESLFTELVDMHLHRQKALCNLKEIYQQEKDWPRCLEVARLLETVSRQSQAVDIAHYYCEQADEALAVGDEASAWACIGKALVEDAHCVRATLLRGDMERARDDNTAAVQSYRQALEQDADFGSEILPRLVDCYRQSADTENLKGYLLDLYEKLKDPRIMLALADILRETEGSQSAEHLVTQHLQEHTDLAALERFIGLKREAADGEAYRDTLDVLARLTARLLEEKPKYQCTRCGFSARRLHWQCPGCKGWGTVRPVQSEVVDAH